ncbi:MAG: hypothetical protein QGF18_02680 [Alphaproteobacteria bacterium]|nr:hypothetical protein [Alphaproteobacteria bacterium]
MAHLNVFGQCSAIENAIVGRLEADTAEPCGSVLKGRPTQSVNQRNDACEQLPTWCRLDKLTHSITGI